MHETTATDATVTDERAAFVRQFDQAVAETTAQDTTVPAPQAGSDHATAASQHERFLHPLRSVEVVFGVAAILVWLLFFMAGTFVATEPHRNTITGGTGGSFFGLLKAWWTVMTCYTLTNVAILSCLAAVIGKFARRSLAYENASIRRLTPAPMISLREVLVLYSVAIARGWVIYLMLAAGLIILTTEAITNAKQDDYIRLAGTVSVVAFLAGYDADLFKRALDRIAAFSSDGKRRP